jgi:hypothetical protein
MQDNTKTVIVPPGSSEFDRVFDLAKAERTVRVRIGEDVFTVTYDSAKLSGNAREFLLRGGKVED